MSERLKSARIIKKGEKVSRILEVVDTGNKVVYKQSVENKTIALGFYVDLSRKTLDQILLAAAEHFVIRDLRKNHFAKLSQSELMDCHGQTFEMTLYEPVYARGKKSDYDRARDNTLKLSEAEFIKLLTDEYGLPESKARELYKKKHGIKK